MAKVTGKKSFLRDKFLELITLLGVFIRGNNPGQGGSNDGVFASWIKTKFHSISREDENKTTVVVRNALSDDELRRYDTFKIEMKERGIDSDYWRVNFAGIIKEDPETAKKVLREVLFAPSWEEREASLKRYYLYKRFTAVKSLWVTVRENKGWTIYAITLFIFLMIISLNNSVR